MSSIIIFMHAHVCISILQPFQCVPGIQITIRLSVPLQFLSIHSSHLFSILYSDAFLRVRHRFQRLEHITVIIKNSFMLLPFFLPLFQNFLFAALLLLFDKCRPIKFSWHFIDLWLPGIRR
jgi:hypothetical protein